MTDEAVICAALELGVPMQEILTVRNLLVARKRLGESIWGSEILALWAVSKLVGGHVAAPGEAPKDADALLGQRALVLVLKHEWNGGDCGGISICPECTAPKYPGPNDRHVVGPDGELVPFHKPGCEWGRVVKMAKGGA